MVAGVSIGAGIVRGITALFGHADASVIAEHAVNKHKRVQAVTIAVVVALLILAGIVPGVTAPVTKTIAENYTFYPQGTQSRR